MARDAVNIVNRAPGIPILLGTFKPSNEQSKTTSTEQKKKIVTRVSKDEKALAEKQTAGKVGNSETLYVRGRTSVTLFLARQISGRKRK